MLFRSQKRHATRFGTFCREYLNPFLNYHRPCLFATELADPKKPGPIKRVYCVVPPMPSTSLVIRPKALLTKLVPTPRLY